MEDARVSLEMANDRTNFLLFALSNWKETGLQEDADWVLPLVRQDLCRIGDCIKEAIFRMKGDCDDPK